MGQREGGNPQREDRKQNAQPNQPDPKREQPNTPEQKEGKPQRREQQDEER